MPYTRLMTDKKPRITKVIGQADYITQPKTNVAKVKGQVVIAPNYPYKTRTVL